MVFVIFCVFLYEEEKERDTICLRFVSFLNSVFFSRNNFHNAFILRRSNFFCAGMFLLISASVLNRGGFIIFVLLKCVIFWFYKNPKEEQFNSY